MSRTRRQFLLDAAAVAALASIPKKRAHAQSAPLATVIATWDYGLELVIAAQKALAAKKELLDALEIGVNVVENDPTVHTVGYGGMPNEDGVVQLDAAIIDGRTHRAGSVAAIERIKNPISVARKVMERTEHVLLVGAGANAFAKKYGFAETDLLTPESRAAWLKAKASFWKKPDEHHDTVCCIGIDARGDLATAVSTSGLPWKLAGRVGDSPIIGAGSYVDNEVGGACATGVGELTMRTCASFAVVERMRAGAEPSAACTAVLNQILRIAREVRTNPHMQLAFIAMNKRGQVGAAVYRKQKKVFRYALARGNEAPALHEVAPLLPA
ncbi:MAG TPA: N(4)-(beta-N-acetylglucosaminyl)-L-asparaginase [Polyangia bacterium]|jgi:isoaspartyl peptidase/L-asparaginase-like protein (Ntn-hydrolase superfamily)